MAMWDSSGNHCFWYFPLTLSYVLIFLKKKKIETGSSEMEYACIR